MALVTIRRIKERPLQEQWDIVGWWIYQSYQFALAADPRKEDWAESFSLSLSLAIHSITHMSGRKVQVENDGTYAIPKKTYAIPRWEYEKRGGRGESLDEWLLEPNGHCAEGLKENNCHVQKRPKIDEDEGAGCFWSKQNIYFSRQYLILKQLKQ